MKNYTTILLFFALCSVHITAQSDFQLTTTQVDYQSLENPMMINSGNWEDEVFTLPIDFTFEYLGQSFDKLYIQDGQISFDNENLLIPFGKTDLEDKGIGTLKSLSPISYQYEMVKAQTILKIEFKNVGFYNGNKTDFANFQVWLYEGSNMIEFHYGASEVLETDFTFDAFTGPVVGIFNESEAGLKGLQIIGSNKNIYNQSIENSDFSLIQAFNGIPQENTVIRFESNATQNPVFVQNNLVETIPIRLLGN